MPGQELNPQKAVLISIQPQWCELIASGKKTVEVRKTRPQIEPPFKCYIYCTNAKPFLVWGDVFRGNWETEITTLSGYSREAAEKIWEVFNGNVLGEFVCDRIDPADVYHIKDIAKAACLSMPDMWEYGRKTSAYDLFGWHISNLQIYDTPKPLTDFVVRECLWENIRNNGCIDASKEQCFDCRLKRPPQSWCYVQEE